MITNSEMLYRNKLAVPSRLLLDIGYGNLSGQGRDVKVKGGKGGEKWMEGKREERNGGKRTSSIPVLLFLTAMLPPTQYDQLLSAD